MAEPWRIAEFIAGRCPACRHPNHRSECIARLPWWRRWVTGLELCACTYWDARWESR